MLTMRVTEPGAHGGVASADAEDGSGRHRSPPMLSATWRPSAVNVPSSLAVANYVKSKLNSYTGSITVPFATASLLIGDVNLGPLPGPSSDLEILRVGGGYADVYAGDFFLDDVSLQSLLDGKQPTVALGQYAGGITQETRAVAIGASAGFDGQGADAIAIGYLAGTSLQSTGGVAIGALAGRINQGTNSVAVGRDAGRETQGYDCVAVGNLSGFREQEARAVAFGFLAGSNYQGVAAIAIGSQAQGLSAGGSSIAIGGLAGHSH